MDIRSWLRPRHPIREGIPYYFLFIGIVTTLMLSLYINRVADGRDQLRFSAITNRTQDNIENRLETYTSLLRTGAGFFYGSEYVDRNEFKKFVDELNLKEYYPGIQGIGFSAVIQSSEKNQFTQRMRNEGIVNFKIYPDHERPVYHSIIYLEPMDRRNQQAIGYDMFTETTRREAMERARNTGGTAASGKVTLVQEIDADKQAGFLIYMPVYWDDWPVETVEQRRAALRGYVYSPFRADDLLTTISGDSGQEGVNYIVYDGSVAVDENILHKSADDIKLGGNFLNPQYTKYLTANVAGRDWTIFYVTNSNFPQSFERSIITYVLILGFGTSFVLFFLMRLQNLARQRAEKAAADLRSSQQALKHSEERYRLVVENANDLVTIIDDKGKYIYASPSHKKVAGYSPDELVNRDKLAMVFSQDLAIVKKALSIYDKPKNRRIIYRLQHKKGYLITLEGVVSKIYNDKSKSWLTLLISRDITEREELQRRKDEFISIASHELKTPITSLKAYTQVLQRWLSKTENQNMAVHLSKMDAQIDRLTNLVRDLLDVTKIEAGQLKLREEVFEIDKLAEEVVEELQHTTDHHKIDLNNNINKYVHGDRDRIGQVFTNLISNAIKYSPEASKIVVSLSVENNKVIVAVKDYGIGIPKEKHKIIFDRFSRVENRKSKEISGLGLGLYISSQIIKRHHGNIWVDSDKGKGSTFYFSLPVNDKKRS